MIRDVGSMHGTMLNGSKLQKDLPQPLRDGDHVIFGTEVRRGDDTFPGCGFDIFYLHENEV